MYETKLSVASKLADVSHPVACPSQWLPVLLATEPPPPSHALMSGSLAWGDADAACQAVGLQLASVQSPSPPPPSPPPPSPPPDVPSGLHTRGQYDEAWPTPSKPVIAGSAPSLDQGPSDPDSGRIGGVHRTPYSKLRGTLLAIVGAAPVALAIAGAAPVVLAVRVSHGTAYSPKTMGLVLIHLAMLSTASGWELPSSEESTDPETTTTGEVDGARDGRRLASSCDGWCVCPPRPCFPPVHVSVPLSSCPQRFNSTAAVMRVRHSRKRWWLRLRLCLGPFCGRWRLRLR